MPKRQLEPLARGEPTSELQSAGARSGRVLPQRRPARAHGESSVEKSTGVERLDSALIGKAPGPRTPQGKARSKLNALKHGLLSKAVLLKNESRAEYAPLLDGLRESLQPQGRLENELVENLAVIWWRKRRLLQAEKAEISKADVLKREALTTQLVQKLNYVLPEGPLVGKPGNRSNLSVLREAMHCIEKYRLLLTVEKGERLEQVRRIHFGPLSEDAADREHNARELMEMTRLTPTSPNGDESASDQDQSEESIRKRALKGIDTEFDRLAELLQFQAAIELLKIESNFQAACIPTQDAMDRLLRYEAHLSREFDRTLNQLERLQRMRKGQPVPPSLRLEVSS